MDGYTATFVAFCGISILAGLITAATCSAPSRVHSPGALLTAFFAWGVVFLDVVLLMGTAIGKDALNNDLVCELQGHALVFIGNVASASWGLRAIVGHVSYFQPLVTTRVTDRRCVGLALISGLVFSLVPPRFFDDPITYYHNFCYLSNAHLWLHLSSFVLPMLFWTSTGFSLGLYTVWILLRLQSLVWGEEKREVVLSITRQLVLNFVFAAVFVGITMNQIWGCLVFPNSPPDVVTFTAAVAFTGTGLWVFFIVGLTRRNVFLWREILRGFCGSPRPEANEHESMPIIRET
eukprot:TRINITY_DN19971_c0_g1_i1.p1 TRINITY_DN19971_c0_g1~~TRINITY_DN19971_c0_g1_i1.p1  ORF type:complete len:292 (-),score=24.98 TRINITY_DN19971_c0_g1_i1:160-1035(-)